MFLSDLDMEQAINDGKLIVQPETRVGPTSIDLHLDSIDQAKIWNTKKYANLAADHGRSPHEVMVARWDYARMSREYLKEPPKEAEAVEQDKVFRRDGSIILKPLGFVLWQTKEQVGTPETDPAYICFVNGKSTRSRTGLMIHLTAPTIHAGWRGNITLEIANLGPFHLVIQENDVIAQITVAQLSRSPRGDMKDHKSATHLQTSVQGAHHTS